MRKETMHYVHEGAGGERGQPCTCCFEPMGHVWREAVTDHGIKILVCACGVEWDDHRILRAPCEIEPGQHPPVKPDPATMDDVELRSLRDAAIIEEARQHPEMQRKDIAEKYGVQRQWVSKLLCAHGLRSPLGGRGNSSRRC